MLNDTKIERVPLQMGWAVPAAHVVGAARTRWEYLSLQTDGDAETITTVRGGAPHVVSGAALPDVLDALGSDDWELVSVVPRSPGGFLYIFKRPLHTP